MIIFLNNGKASLTLAFFIFPIFPNIYKRKKL
nr:MAG TPA: hypothetical protein [Caudoviricetes sp.]